MSLYLVIACNIPFKKRVGNQLFQNFDRKIFSYDLSLYCDILIHKMEFLEFQNFKLHIVNHNFLIVG